VAGCLTAQPPALLFADVRQRRVQHINVAGVTEHVGERHAPLAQDRQHDLALVPGGPRVHAERIARHRLEALAPLVVARAGQRHLEELTPARGPLRFAQPVDRLLIEVARSCAADEARIRGGKGADDGSYLGIA
jgi:hypothetical protein